MHRCRLHQCADDARVLTFVQLELILDVFG